MEMEPKLSVILSRYPFRDGPTRQLLHYLNLNDSNRILAYGPRATCKTSIVDAVVKQFELFHAWINVLHHVSTRNIYESILKQLKSQLMARLDGVQNVDIEDLHTACNSSLAFIEKLNTLLGYFLPVIENSEHHQVPAYQKRLVIVLDNADSLFNDENNEFIYVMNFLEVLTKRSYYISVIYISMHSGEWVMRHCESKCDFAEVVFNNYTLQELNHLLTQRALSASEYSKEFYANYVNVILKAFNNFTRNFVELQNICLSNFKHYTKPIEEEEISPKDSAKLFLRIQPKLQEITSNLHDHKIVRMKASLEFSPSMNYLLVAAYLASYNSSKGDKRHFVRNQGRIRERRKSKKNNNQELESKAPKPFTFERLFHIYQALLNLNESKGHTRKHLMVSSIVIQQFNELIKQKLIMAINSAGNSASISSVSRYQLSDSVTSKLIKDIAFSIRLKLTAFMESA